MNELPTATSKKNKKTTTIHLTYRTMSIRISV